MPIAFVILPFILAGGVLGALTFASQETEDMSPAEVTKKLNRCASCMHTARFFAVGHGYAMFIRCELFTRYCTAHGINNMVLSFSWLQGSY